MHVWLTVLLFSCIPMPHILAYIEHTHEEQEHQEEEEVQVLERSLPTPNETKVTTTGMKHSILT